MQIPQNKKSIHITIISLLSFVRLSGSKNLRINAKTTPSAIAITLFSTGFIIVAKDIVATPPTEVTTAIEIILSL